MAELTLLVNSTDTALLSGNAVSPVAPSASVGGAPVAGGFASVLGSQLAPTQAAPVSQSPPEIASTTVTAVSESGDGQPLAGNPLPPATLPETSQLTDDAPGVLNPALLQSLLQGQTGSGRPVSSGTLTDPLASPLDANLPSQNRAALLKMLNASHSVSHIERPGASAVATGLNPNITAQASGQQPAVQTSVLPLTNASEQAQQASAAPAVHAMLGKPISMAAQQALVRASLNAGKATVLRGESVNASGPNALAGQLNPTGVATGLNPAAGVLSRMEMFNAAMRSATKGDASVDLSQLSRAANTATTASTAPMSALAEDANGFSAALQRMPGVASSGFTPSLSVATPVGHSAWANDLGQRVTWLANNELREAQLQLHPRSLGTVEVRIAFGHEQQLNISFSAANPVAREALDASLPRLREMLEQQGLQLADANISHESFAEREQRQQVVDGRAGGGDTSDDIESTSELLAEHTLASIRVGEGMLDAYA